jgi:hypothetical protein
VLKSHGQIALIGLERKLSVGSINLTYGLDASEHGMVRLMTKATGV